MQDAKVRVGQGRDLAFTQIGQAGWLTVLFFHGAPAGRLRLRYLEEKFLAHRVCVVSPDRPGYGGSTPRPGRTLSDWPTDVELLADELGLERFIVAGHSSGGPYALACAAGLESRVTQAIVLCGVTDMAWPGAWSGYPASEIELMRRPSEAAAVAWCKERFGADGQDFAAASGFTLSGPDEALYSDEAVAPLLAAARYDAFRQGVGGYAQDMFIQGRPWSFDPAQIRIPVQLFHGDQDLLLPMAHTHHTAALVPDATVHVLPGHGHFTILSELPTVVSALLDS